MAFLLWPLYVLYFWYVDGTRRLIVIARDVVVYTLELFSLPLLIRTFFKPVKNEYRKNLILFSILFGMVVKTFLILFSMCFVIGMIVLVVLVFLIYLAIPLSSIALLFL